MGIEKKGNFSCLIFPSSSGHFFCEKLIFLALNALSQLGFKSCILKFKCTESQGKKNTTVWSLIFSSLVKNIPVKTILVTLQRPTVVMLTVLYAKIEKTSIKLGWCIAYNILFRISTDPGGTISKLTRETAFRAQIPFTAQPAHILMEFGNRGKASRKKTGATHTPRTAVHLFFVRAPGPAAFKCPTFKH